MARMNCMCWRPLVTIVMAMVMVMVPVSVMGRTVTVSSIEVAPYLTREEVKGVAQYDGFIKELLDEVGKIVSVTFTLTTNPVFGKEVNGTWSGVVGDVVNQNVELAAAPLTVTSERNAVVRFTVPVQSFGPVIVLRRPRVSQPSFTERFQRLFAPLSHSVWLMSLLAYFITSVILYVVCHYNPYEWRQMHRERQATIREGEAFTCMNAFWFVLSTWMIQGFVRAPRSLGGRVVVTSWWIFVLVFVLTYNASLTNLLRVGPTPLEDERFVPVTGLEDLARQNTVRFGFVRGGSTESYFKNAKVPYLRRIWDDVNKRQDHTLRVEDGTRRVRESLDSQPFAFIMESAMATYMLRQKPCDLYMVGDLSITGSYAFAYRPGWDLATQVDNALLIVRERGILKLLEDKWFQGKCDNNVLDPNVSDKIKVSPFHPVTLGSFSGVLVVVLGGVFLGALVTIIEVIVFKKAEMTSSDDEASTPIKGREPGKATKRGGKSTANAPENVTDV